MVPGTRVFSVSSTSHRPTEATALFVHDHGHNHRGTSGVMRTRIRATDLRGDLDGAYRLLKHVATNLTIGGVDESAGLQQVLESTCARIAAMRAELGAEGDLDTVRVRALLRQVAHEIATLRRSVLDPERLP